VPRIGDTYAGASLGGQAGDLDLLAPRPTAGADAAVRPGGWVVEPRGVEPLTFALRIILPELLSCYGKANRTFESEP